MAYFAHSARCTPCGANGTCCHNTSAAGLPLGTPVRHGGCIVDEAVLAMEGQTCAADNPKRGPGTPAAPPATKALPGTRGDGAAGRRTLFSSAAALPSAGSGPVGVNRMAQRHTVTHSNVATKMAREHHMANPQVHSDTPTGLRTRSALCNRGNRHIISMGAKQIGGGDRGMKAQFPNAPPPTPASDGPGQGVTNLDLNLNKKHKVYGGGVVFVFKVMVPYGRFQATCVSGAPPGPNRVLQGQQKQNEAQEKKQLLYKPVPEFPGA